MVEEIYDNFITDGLSCMECMSSYCNGEGTSGAGHLALSGLFLVLSVVLLY